MKKNLLLIMLSVFIFSSCSYNRIGQLTMISTRNVDSKADYKLIQKETEGIAKMKSHDAFQEAVENAVKQSPDGEFMKNVIVYIQGNGKKIKVVGDIWGIPSVNKQVEKTVNAKIEFKAGDKVTFKNSLGKIIEGKILGVNANTAIVEYQNTFGKTTKSEINYEDLTKIGE